MCADEGYKGLRPQQKIEIPFQNCKIVQLSNSSIIYYVEESIWNRMYTINGRTSEYHFSIQSLPLLPKLTSADMSKNTLWISLRIS